MFNPFRASSTDALHARATTLVKDADALAASHVGSRSAAEQTAARFLEMAAAHDAEARRAMTIRERIAAALDV